jgi:hypothetical protein
MPIVQAKKGYKLVDSVTSPVLYLHIHVFLCMHIYMRTHMYIYNCPLSPYFLNPLFSPPNSYPHTLKSLPLFILRYRLIVMPLVSLEMIL